jgi:hypothetical protein
MTSDPMTNQSLNRDGNVPTLRDAARFWERGRIFYNAILIAIVLLWVVLTWPHFRPALSLSPLLAMAVLGLLANVCYSAAYAAEIVLLRTSTSRRLRWALWSLGTLFAIVLENYWIADEIYPSVPNDMPNFFGAQSAVGPFAFASNLNFPAPLGVLGFLAACGGVFVAFAAALIFWFARKPKFARIAALILGTGAVGYFGLLLGFSAGSHTAILARGQEKYFCEIDCHLAYAIVDVKTQPEAESTRFVVALRTRFDETTISAQRPKDAPLTPSPREVRVIDSNGREYVPASTEGTPLMTPLKPGDSYTTELEFNVPKDASGLRLLINTRPQWPDHLVIGDENSWLHKKTYFAL